MDVNKDRSYKTVAELMDECNCSASYVYMIRAFIKKHPERYPYISISGSLTNIFAFIDAKELRRPINKGQHVPPFDVETAAMMYFGRRSRK